MNNIQGKIVDCFTFYNELEILEFRLAELNDIVDHFILVEATYTHAGNKKELFFDSNKDRYSKYLDKIIHVIVEDMPNTNNAWDNERWQRICIDRGMSAIKLNDVDIIIISDADEVPDPRILKKIKNKKLIIDKIFALEQDLYYYNLTFKKVKKWYKSKIVNYLDYKTKYKNNSNSIRMHMLGSCDIIHKGGWHFSYFGDTDFIINKIQNFAHQEFNNKKYTNKKALKTIIENGLDLYYRKGQDFKKIQIEDNDYLPLNYEILL